jgi:hypothetical protein
MAPHTAQGATFEEHGGANAWSIVNRELFDIEYQTTMHKSTLALFSKRNTSRLRFTLYSITQTREKKAITLGERPHLAIR